MPPDEPQLLPQSGTRCRRRVVCRTRRPPPRPHRAGENEQSHEHSHAAVAPGRAESVPHHRRDAAADEDGERENCDAPGHQPRAFGIVAGQLRGHRDIGDLEERIGARAADERQHDPGRSNPDRRRRSAEQDHEQDRERDACTHEERPAPSVRMVAAVTDPPRDRVENDVPRLGEQHDQAGERHADAEAIGEIRQEKQPRHGRERPGRHRTEGIADPDGPGQWSDRRTRRRAAHGAHPR